MNDYINIIRRNKIKIAFLQFCDMLGDIKGIYIPICQLKSAIKNGVNFDGSSIKFYGKTKNSDNKFFVDTSSFYVLPNNVITFFCYVKHEHDSRYRLMCLEKELAQLGYYVQIGAELEFFIFELKNNKPNIKKLERVGYFSEINIKKLNMLKEVVTILNNQNFKIEAVHHECAKNQYELDFRFCSPVEVADKVLIAKQVIKHVAKKHNLYASFMPKPIANLAGSGMHINLSVTNGEKNLFYDNTKMHNLSELAQKITNNIAMHVGAICAFSNPLVNSYKRLNANMETPCKVNISFKDRSSCFRVPAFEEKSARVECRFPDVAGQIYLTLSAIILSGFKHVLMPNSNFLGKKIKVLPTSLLDSLKNLKADELINSLVPSDYFNEIQSVIRDYEKQITPYELKRYL